MKTCIHPRNHSALNKWNHFFKLADDSKKIILCSSYLLRIFPSQSVVNKDDFSILDAKNSLPATCATPAREAVERSEVLAILRNKDHISLFFHRLFEYNLFCSYCMAPLVRYSLYYSRIIERALGS